MSEFEFVTVEMPVQDALTYLNKLQYRILSEVAGLRNQFANFRDTQTERHRKVMAGVQELQAEVGNLATATAEMATTVDRVTSAFTTQIDAAKAEIQAAKEAAQAIQTAWDNDEVLDNAQIADLTTRLEAAEAGLDTTGLVTQLQEAGNTIRSASQKLSALAPVEPEPTEEPDPTEEPPVDGGDGGQGPGPGGP
jgi:hypothetical protein